MQDLIIDDSTFEAIENLDFIENKEPTKDSLAFYLKCLKIYSKDLNKYKNFDIAGEGTFTFPTEIKLDIQPDGVNYEKAERYSIDYSNCGVRLSDTKAEYNIDREIKTVLYYTKKPSDYELVKDWDPSLHLALFIEELLTPVEIFNYKNHLAEINKSIRLFFLISNSEIYNPIPENRQRITVEFSDSSIQNNIRKATLVEIKETIDYLSKVDDVIGLKASDLKRSNELGKLIAYMYTCTDYGDKLLPGDVRTASIIVGDIINLIRNSTLYYRLSPLEQLFGEKPISFYKLRGDLDNIDLNLYTPRVATKVGNCSPIAMPCQIINFDRCREDDITNRWLATKLGGKISFTDLEPVEDLTLKYGKLECEEAIHKALRLLRVTAKRPSIRNLAYTIYKGTECLVYVDDEDMLVELPVKYEGDPNTYTINTNIINIFPKPDTGLSYPELNKLAALYYCLEPDFSTLDGYYQNEDDYGKMCVELGVNIFKMGAIVSELEAGIGRSNLREFSHVDSYITIYDTINYRFMEKRDKNSNVYRLRLLTKYIRG